MRRLSEGVGQLPLLRFVAPLRGRVRNDVVRVAVGADRCRPCGWGRSPIGALDRLLFQMKRIEKGRMCHLGLVRPPCCYPELSARIGFVFIGFFLL